MLYRILLSIISHWTFWTMPTRETTKSLRLYRCSSQSFNRSERKRWLNGCISTQPYTKMYTTFPKLYTIAYYRIRHTLVQSSSLQLIISRTNRTVTNDTTISFDLIKTESLVWVHFCHEPGCFYRSPYSGWKLPNCCESRGKNYSSTNEYVLTPLEDAQNAAEAFMHKEVEILY